MNTRICAWLVVLLVAGLAALPHPARATDKPTQPSFERTMENDPWRPDTNDPARTLADRDQGIAEDQSAAPVIRERTPRPAWHRVLMHILRLRGYWGFMR